MKIEAGKRYVTRNGDITGGLQPTVGIRNEAKWLDFDNLEEHSGNDLVREYIEDPTDTTEEQISEAKAIISMMPAYFMEGRLTNRCKKWLQQFEENEITKDGEEIFGN